MAEVKWVKITTDMFDNWRRLNGGAQDVCQDDCVI